MSIKIKLGDRQTAIPPGEYRVKVTDIREGSFVGKRKSLEFVFEVADGEHAGVTLRGYVNAHYEAFSEYTKLRRWLDAVTKLDSEPGGEVDLDIFFKKVLRVKVENKASKKTGNVFSNVTEVLGVVCEL